jgi:hypothetical protein
MFIFLQSMAKNSVFCSKHGYVPSICKIWIITLIFKKIANFFAENGRKSLKTVIMSSTLGCSGRRREDQFRGVLQHRGQHRRPQEDGRRRLIRLHRQHEIHFAPNFLSRQLFSTIMEFLRKNRFEQKKRLFATFKAIFFDDGTLTLSCLT